MCSPKTHVSIKFLNRNYAFPSIILFACFCFSGDVVTMECYEKLIKKDMIHPLTNSKLKEKDIIVLQRVSVTFINSIPIPLNVFYFSGWNWILSDQHRARRKRETASTHVLNYSEWNADPSKSYDENKTNTHFVRMKSKHL